LDIGHSCLDIPVWTFLFGHSPGIKPALIRWAIRKGLYFCVRFKPFTRRSLFIRRSVD